jgi:hypothetical protein
MSELCVMGPSGDTKTIWDKNKPDEVGAARQQFDTLRKKGYLAYRVQPGGKTGEASTTTCDTWGAWPSCTASSTTAIRKVEWVQMAHRVTQPAITVDAKAYAAAIERRRRIDEERKAEDERQRVEAKAKARALLESLLNEKQARQLQDEKKFHVIGSDGVRYEVDCTKRQHNVFALNETGQRVREFCLVQTGNTPLEDHLACQKLLLESNAPEFHRVANKWDLNHAGRRELVS